MHCFISTTSPGARGVRWAWHIADDNGVSRKHSDTEFVDFHACVDDARAHGYRHVEVPVLHWSCADDGRPAGIGPVPSFGLDPADASGYAVRGTQ